MDNTEYIKRHIEHAEYNRDVCLARAELARLCYRASKRFDDYKDWKENVRQAWAMRRIVKENRKRIGQ
jgi:hypothetical protein